jgi:hypothetical protein
MHNAITVRAVMAFSLLGFAPTICAGDSVEVVVSLFDKAGHLPDCDWGPVESLVPGASAPFEVSFERLRGYHHYDVQVNPDYREKHWNE